MEGRKAVTVKGMPCQERLRALACPAGEEEAGRQPPCSLRMGSRRCLALLLELIARVGVAELLGSHWTLGKISVLWTWSNTIPGERPMPVSCPEAFRQCFKLRLPLKLSGSWNLWFLKVPSNWTTLLKCQLSFHTVAVPLVLLHYLYKWYMPVLDNMW